MITYTGQAMTLNGTTQYANRSIISTVNDNFSMIIWANFSSFGAAANDIFDNGSSDANGYCIRVSNAGLFSFDYTFVDNLTSGFTLSTGTWYQLAVIRNATIAQCYVNANAQGLTKSSTPNTPATWTTIGASQVSGGGAGNFGNCSIQEVRFYERPISTAELTQLYNRASNSRDYGDISSANLKAHWVLDGNYVDTSGNGLTLTPNATPTFGAGTVETRRVSAGEYNIARSIVVGDGMSRSEGAT